MADLYRAMALVLAAAAGAFFVGRRVSRATSPRVAGALAFLTCAFIVCFALFVRDHLLLTRLVPSSAVIIYGNPLPPAVALLCGIGWHRMPGRAWRKGVLLLPLALLCLYQSYGLLLGRPPPLDERWKNGVCRQTSSASCSAAAAATLLRAYGIDATEAGMAQLCLTRQGGTPMLGLYRGLKLKTAGTGKHVQAFRGDLATLRAEAGPVILSVRLDRRPGVDPRYEQLWGWAPGVSHTVVFFGFRADGKAEIGDPAVGREHWRVQDLEELWHGEGLRLAD
jgi:predicted double-glycine peptidase